MLYRIRCNPMHPLYGALTLPVPYMCQCWLLEVLWSPWMSNDFTRSTFHATHIDLYIAFQCKLYIYIVSRLVEINLYNICILVRLLAAEPRSTYDFYFPLMRLCGTIFADHVFDGDRLAGFKSKDIVFFNILSCWLHFCLLLSFLYLISFYLLVLWG